MGGKKCRNLVPRFLTFCNSGCVELVMVRTTMWLAVVVRREEVEDDRPSALPLRKVTVNIFLKGERIVLDIDILPYPPALESSNRKPKD